jgi:hypothetical protein
MSTVVVPHAVKRAPHVLYYFKGRNLWASPMRGHRGKKTMICANCITRRKGYMYFVDGRGNVCEAKMKKRRAS